MTKKLTPKQKKLASLSPPFNKITRGDIIKGATMKKGKKVTAGQLRQVYNKGLAAYKTGHRPGTTPNQWAMARVNSVLTGGKAKAVDAHIFGKGKKPKKKPTKKA